MLREDWTYAQLCQAVMQVSPSHSVAGSQSRELERAACLPEKRGDRSENHGCKSRRDGWWELKSRCRIQYSDELGLDITKRSTRAKWRFENLERVGGEVSPKFA